MKKDKPLTDKGFWFLVIGSILISYLILYFTGYADEIKKEAKFCNSYNGVYLSNIGCIIKTDNSTEFNAFSTYKVYNIYKLNDTDYVLVRK